MTIDRPDPVAIARKLSAYADLCAASPDEVATIVGVVHELLTSGPTVTSTEPWEHLADHLHNLLPVLLKDPRIDAVTAALTAKYKAQLDAAGTDFSPAKIGVLAGAAVLLAAAEVIASCIEGPHPKPGMSAATHC